METQRITHDVEIPAWLVAATPPGLSVEVGERYQFRQQHTCRIFNEHRTILSSLPSTQRPQVPTQDGALRFSKRSWESRLHTWRVELRAVRTEHESVDNPKDDLTIDRNM